MISPLRRGNDLPEAAPGRLGRHSQACGADLCQRELAQIRVRYGYRRIGVSLHREGWTVGPHVLRRVYGEECLVLRPRRPRGTSPPSAGNVRASKQPPLMPRATVRAKVRYWSSETSGSEIPGRSEMTVLLRLISASCVALLSSLSLLDSRAQAVAPTLDAHVISAGGNPQTNSCFHLSSTLAQTVAGYSEVRAKAAYVVIARFWFWKTPTSVPDEIFFSGFEDC